MRRGKWKKKIYIKKSERRRKETDQEDGERDKVFCDLTGPNVNGHARVLK